MMHSAQKNYTWVPNLPRLGTVGRWCKRAIWENTLPSVKRVWKSVENLTSGVFLNMWQNQVAHFYAHYSGATTK
jgi:hypothetical protein